MESGIRGLTKGPKVPYYYIETRSYPVQYSEVRAGYGFLDKYLIALNNPYESSDTVPCDLHDPLGYA